MNNTVSASIIGIAIVLAAWVVGQNMNHPTTITTASQNSVSVNGDGQVFAQPDTFTLDVLAEEKTKTTAEGFAAVGKKVALVQKLLKENGIADKDIQSVNIAINPNYVYDNGKSSVDGFVATHGLKIKIRKLASIDTILSGVSNIPGIQIQNTSYDIDDKTEFYRQAREMAIAKARQKAEDMAKATGIKLGKISSLSESQSYNPPMYQNQMFKMSAEATTGGATGVSVGQLELTTTVSISYEID